MITEAEARAIVLQPKQTLNALVWVARQNHAGVKHCSAVLADLNGVTIPGLTVELEVKAPIVAAACFYQLTIFRFAHGRRTRAYQLAVFPASKKSHIDAQQVIYGPHEHFGEPAFAVTDQAVGCDRWPSTYAWFLNRCNLQAPTIDLP